MNKEDYEKYMKNLEDAEKTPTSHEFPFDVISKKTSFLKMFCDIIDKHPEDLEETYKKTQEKRQFKPSATLIDYFVLNIYMFYECAKIRFEIDRKDMPSTYIKVKRFRNKVMAHFDKNIKSNEQLVKEYRRVNDSDGKGFDRIWEEYIQFRDKIFERLKNG